MTTSCGSRAWVGVPLPTYPSSAEPLSTRDFQPAPRVLAAGRVRAVRPPDVVAGGLGGVGSLLLGRLADGLGVLVGGADDVDDATEGGVDEEAALALAVPLSDRAESASATTSPTATAATNTGAPTMSSPRRARASPAMVSLR